jgi:hypothetical protein
MGTLVLLAMLAAAANSGGVVVKPVANMYSAPNADTDVVSQAIYAANVGILEEKDGWLKIRTADDYSGWVPAEALRRLKSDEKPYGSAGRVAEVQALFAHLYRGPSVTKNAPLLTVPFETRLEVVAEPDTDNRRWLQVRLPDDRSGWVQRGDIAFAPPLLSIPEMIELAKRFLGLPYTWGGTSSYGYDCSGYAQMLCRRRGISLPRDAEPQAYWSGLKPVETADLQAGDLLYFGSSPQKITHTGVFIGDGRFIHATTNQHPVVQISVLAGAHWTKLLVACRRVK